MKKVLSMVVLMMILAVSVFAVTSDVTVPVYLNVPEFVRISTHPDDDGQFDLVFDPLYPDVEVQDTVTLVVEANVAYTLSSSVTYAAGQSHWGSLIQVTLPDPQTTPYKTGKNNFVVTAKINVIDHLMYGKVDPATKIADVVFTISSL